MENRLSQGIFLEKYFESRKVGYVPLYNWINEEIEKHTEEPCEKCINYPDKEGAGICDECRWGWPDMFEVINEK